MFYVTIFREAKLRKLLYYAKCFDEAEEFCQEHFSGLVGDDYTIDEFESFDEAYEFYSEEADGIYW